MDEKKKKNCLADKILPGMLGDGVNGKLYEHASNAHVNLFIIWVKSVTNSMLFSTKVSYVAIFWVILKAFIQ